MKLLDRDLVSEFFKTYFWFIFILAFIFFVDIFLDLFQEVAEAEDSILGWAFIYYLCRLPRFFIETGVISVSTSILWVITKKARSYELMAYMAGGISPVRLAMPLLISAGLISICSFGLNEFVRVEADRQAFWIEQVHIKQKDPSKFYKNRYIHRRGEQNRFYFVDEHNASERTMFNATIIDLDADTHLPRMILRADFARFVSDPTKPGNSNSSGTDDSTTDTVEDTEFAPELLDISEALESDGKDVWEFENGSIRFFNEQNELTHLDTFDLTDSRKLGVKMDTGIQAYLSDIEKPSEMAFNELINFIILTEKQNKPTNLLKFELYTKIALPLAILLVAMVICSHVLSPKSTGIVAGFGGGLGWIAGYYVLFLVTQRFSALAFELPPVLLAAFPNLVYGAFGCFALYKRHKKI